MSNTITNVFLNFMLNEYKRYEEIKKLSDACLTLDQKTVLMKHAINSFRELATIYLTDYLEIKNGECHLEEMMYEYTESDTNADIYNPIMVYASSYQEMLMLFNLKLEFYQQKDHAEEWRILTLYIQTQKAEDGGEYLSHKVNLGNKLEYSKDIFKSEALTLAEITFVKHLEFEILIRNKM